MECRLSSASGMWSCQIAIRREYDSEGNVLDKVLEISSGEIITGKSDVELSLHRGQLALLNPHL